jgi:hypothetical protein
MINQPTEYINIAQKLEYVCRDPLVNELFSLNNFTHHHVLFFALIRTRF